MSSTALLSLAATTLPGTATHPLAFALHYEFVDARLEGAAGGAALRAEPGACARLLLAPGEFASPRNALWFGRGGARRLRCVYRLQAEGSRLQLTLLAAAFGRDPRCATRPDPRTGQLTCSPLPPDAAGSRTPAALEPNTEFEEDDESAVVPHLWIYESPWPGYRVSARERACGRSGWRSTVPRRAQVPLACLCDNSSAPLKLAGAGALELELAAGRLAAREDHRHLQFRGAWARGGVSRCAVLRRLPPPGASLRLTFPYE